MLSIRLITRQLEHFGGVSRKFSPKGKVTLAMVRNSLFNEEIGRKDFMGNDTHALVTDNKGQSKSRGPFGHNKSRGRSKSRGKIKCYHCGNIGHMKRNYKILKQGGDKSQKQEDNKYTVATTVPVTMR